ncbi:MAG: hypothetical protein NZ802_10185, partial [Candidatus Poseidoniales archaeon]|nr:hypothetical protein [Candidatus Poseidoniales archaeon]
GDRISDAVVADMPHMHFSTGVGIHLKGVELRSADFYLAVKNSLGFPFILPVWLSQCWIPVHPDSPNCRHSCDTPS